MFWNRKSHRRASDQIRSMTRGGILDEQAFWQIVRIEKERADRSGLPVTVAVFTVKEDPDQFHSLAGWNASSLCQLLRETVRLTDHVGIAGANELGVVLWGTREKGAYRFVNRLCKSAEPLADRCNLFVYPELKLTSSSSDNRTTDLQAAEVNGKSTLPQGILKRIAEVERQLSQAVAVETPVDNSLDDDDFDDTYSFGSEDDDVLQTYECVTETLKEISATQNSSDSNEKDSDSDEDSDDDFPDSSGGLSVNDKEVAEPTAASPTAGSQGDPVQNGGAALIQAPPVPARATTQPIQKPVPSTSVEQTMLQNSDLEVQLEPMSNLFLHPFPRWKRMVDILGSGFGLIALAPLLAAIACLIKITSPGPVLFRQRREGYGGKLFQINKFRTMRIGADAEKAQLQAQSEQDGPAFKLENDPRITKLGSFLRKTCLDELPQLWNVLLGDMTLVGPRPLDHRESCKIARWGRRRLNVMPGLTCIWQVHGKSKVTFNEWMRMDIRYSQRVTFRQDMQLVFATLKQVFLRQASH